MFADRALPRAAFAAGVLALAAACGGGGAGGSDVPSPVVRAIEPASGFSGNATEVTIRGDGFLARSDGSGLDTTHRAWLGSTELDAVAWVDSHTLHATVPKGLPAGTLALRVRNAYGKEGTLAEAFTVSTSPGGALAVTSVEATPAALNVGQELSVAAVVRNAGDAAVRDVVARVGVASADGGAALLRDGPSPASVASLGAGEEATFRWSLAATAAGTVTVTATASGQDAFSALLVGDERTTPVTVLLPAGLTTSLVAGRASADTGQDVPVVLSVTNGAGRASARVTAVTPLASGVAATCGAVAPAVPVDVGASSTVQFRWTCQAREAGTLQLRGRVEGNDANDPTIPLADTSAPDQVTIQTAAALQATLALAGSPSVVTLGQPLAATFTVRNTGGGLARLGAITAPSPAAPFSCDPSAPATPVDVAGGASAAFTLRCRPQQQGALSLGVHVEATNVNRGTALSADAASATMTVQYPAAPTALVSASPGAADVGQDVAVSLTVVAGGSLTAGFDDVTVASSVSGTGAARCGAPTPSTPVSIAANGYQTFTWTCTVTAAGSLLLSGTATGVDGNDHQRIVTASPGTPAAVTAQERAALTVLAFQARGTSSVDQEIPVSLTLRNVGGAPARISRVAPTPPEGAAGLACRASASSPLPSAGAPRVLAAGEQVLFEWTCTGTAPGSYTLGAGVVAADANWPESDPAARVAPTSALQVQSHPALTASAFTAQPATADTGQDARVSLTLHNGGGATAQVTALVPGWSTTGAATLTCGAPTPLPSAQAPLAIAGGQSRTFTWTCRGSQAGTFDLRAGVLAADANDGSSADRTAIGGPLAVVTPAHLAGGMALAAGSVAVGQDATVTLSLSNDGGAAALALAVSPAVRSGAGSCDAVPALAPLSPGAGVDLQWRCRGTAAGSLLLGVDVAGTDGNDPTRTVTAAIADVTLIVTPPLPALTATLTADATAIHVGGTVNLTLTVANGAGAGSAQLTAIAPGTSTGALDCPALLEGLPVTLAGGASTVFHFACMGAAAGAAVEVRAAVAAGSAATVQSTAATVDVVQIAADAAVTGSLSSSPSTLPAATGGDVVVALTIRNPGRARVRLGSDAVVPTVGAGDAAAFGCRVPTLTPVYLAAGETLGTQIRWTCSSTGGPLHATTSFGARVTATDDAGADASATISGASVRLE